MLNTSLHAWRFLQRCTCSFANTSVFETLRPLLAELRKMNIRLFGLEREESKQTNKKSKKVNYWLYGWLAEEKLFYLLTDGETRSKLTCSGQQSLVGSRKMKGKQYGVIISFLKKKCVFWICLFILSLFSLKL